MARLSEAHYESNPGTPRPERKTNRFRGIFKHRSSSSVSLSPNLITKKQSASSPVMPPTIQPGFERIGLLPSERSSFEAARRVLDNFGGPTFSEMLKEDMKDYSYNKSPSAGRTTPVHGTPANGHTKDLKNKKEAIVNSSSPIPGSSIHNVTEIGFSPPAPVSRIIADDAIGEGITAFKRFKQAVTPPLDSAAPVLTADDSFISCDDRDSQRKSFASNIFDDDDSLSQGIREFVASKIAEAINEHDVKLAREKQEIHDMHMEYNSQVNLHVPALKAIQNVVGCETDRVDLWTSSRSVGPVTVGHTRTANLLQYVIVVFYVISLLGAALSGPKDMLLAFWRLIVIIGVYSMALQHLGWAEYVRQDVFISPVIYFGQELKVWGQQMFVEGAQSAQSSLVFVIKTHE